MQKYVSDMCDPNLKRPIDRAIMAAMRKERFLAVKPLSKKIGFSIEETQAGVSRLVDVGYLEERSLLESTFYIIKA